MVPSETSSAYMANERILLPEDSVSAFYVCVLPAKKLLFSHWRFLDYALAHQQSLHLSVH